MNQPLRETPSEEIKLTDFKSAQVRTIFSAIPASLVTILINSTILSAILWQEIDHTNIIAWFLATNSLSLFRWFLYRQLRKMGDRDEIDAIWYQLALVTSALSGATWGAAGIWLFAEQSIAHQVFLLFVVGGMAAGAIATLSVILRAAQAFILLSVTPMLVQIILINNQISTAMAIMTILFTARILYSSKNIHDAFIESLVSAHERDIAMERIRSQALYDELTKLPNRRLFLASLDQELARAIRHKRVGAIFFIDLDRFKQINDSLGRSIGDELLVQVVDRICSRIRQEDTAARLGGDKFVVLLPEVGKNIKASSEQAHKIANEIRTSFELPFKIQEHEIHLTISIGVVLFPLEQESSANLVQYADTAMFEAKREGRDAVRLYSEEMQDSKGHHRLIEKGLHKALELNEFELYFQPQFDGSSRVTGIEALLRWHHPDRGLLTPEIFNETAEQTGLIVPIGDWVIGSACEHLGKMDFDSNLDLAVNISPRQFRNPEFIGKITQILHQTGVDPARLKLEITESMLIDNIDQSAGVITQLKQLGIKISVDNFGTGYSSLASLARFSVDEIKIDQSLIRDISNSPDNAVIVETILVTAQHLKLNTIAEGVDTRADLDFLMQINCNKFQGAYFAKPDTFEIFLSLVV